MLRPPATSPHQTLRLRGTMQSSRRATHTHIHTHTHTHTAYQYAEYGPRNRNQRAQGYQLLLVRCLLSAAYRCPGQAEREGAGAGHPTGNPHLITSIHVYVCERERKKERGREGARFTVLAMLHSSTDAAYTNTHAHTHRLDLLLSKSVHNQFCVVTSVNRSRPPCAYVCER